MEATVYVDLFFMINFSMDFLCLFLTSKLLSIKLNIFRGIASAIFGGLYANAALFFTFNSITCFILDIAACLLLCLIAFFKPSEWRRSPIYVLVYTAVSMVLGGFMTALFNLFNRLSIFDGIRESDGDGISVWLFALLAIISGAITLFGGKFFTSRISRKSVAVEFTYDKKAVCLTAMTDSGNMLCEPISGKPCIVADISALSEILPPEIVSAAKNAELMRLDELPWETRKRIFLVPTVTASGSGMLIGVRMDKIKIEKKGKLYEVNATVALSELGKVAENEKVLVPSSLLMN